MNSEQERHFETLWKQLDGCELASEYLFHPTRKWRYDFAIPYKKIAIEIEGGIWAKSEDGKKSRHFTGIGYTGDCEKYNEATMLGWKIFRFTSLMWDDPDKYILPLVKFAEDAPWPCPDCGRAVASTELCDCVPF